MIYSSNYLEQEIQRTEKLITKIGQGQNRTLLLDLVLSGGNVLRAESEYFQWKIEETEDLDPASYGGFKEGAEYGKSGDDPKRKLQKNNCQIFREVAEISGTAMALNPDGIDNHLEKRVEEKLITAKRALNKAMLEGTLQNEDHSNPRKMNGLLNIIQNSIDMENQPIDKTIFTQAMRKLDESGNGGTDRLCFANADIKEFIDGLFGDDAKNHLEIKAGQNTFGVLATSIITNYGTVHVVLDFNMPEGQMMFFDPGQVFLKVLRPFKIEAPVQDADSVKRVVIGEYSVMMKNPYSAVKVINIDLNPGE